MKKLSHREIECISGGCNCLCTRSGSVESRFVGKATNTLECSQICANLGPGWGIRSCS